MISEATAATAGNQLSLEEQQIAKAVDYALQAGRDGLAWFEARAYDEDGHFKADNFAQSFKESFTHNRPDYSVGFFDEATIAGKKERLAGNFQSMYFDIPKADSPQREDAAEWMSAQVREFTLKYLMRVSDYSLPQAYSEGHNCDPPFFLKPLSLCPESNPALRGFGFSQVLYKKKGDNEARCFDQNQKDKIVDLREIGPVYDWVVVKVDIFDFNFAMKPLGSNGPSLSVPMSEASYLAIGPEFITDETVEGGGTYGLGYAFIKNPGPSLLAYGPGEFEFAYQTIRFKVTSDEQLKGKVRVDMNFVANFPKGVMNISMDPFVWGERLADVMTMGMSKSMPLFRMMSAASPARNFVLHPVMMGVKMANMVTGDYPKRELCLSPENIAKEFMLKHFQKHYEMIAACLQSWRQVPDWCLPEKEMPVWVQTGKAV